MPKPNTVSISSLLFLCPKATFHCCNGRFSSRPRSRLSIPHCIWHNPPSPGLMGATISRRRSTQPPPSESLASLPENVLAEIFLNLPPHPAHLRSIALCSHQFRDVVTNRTFLRQFRAHHGDVPPLVGFLLNQRIPRFLPTAFGISRSESDRAAAGAPVDDALEPFDADWLILSTRHGRVLLQSPDRLCLLVLDPMAGRRKYVEVPLPCSPHYPSTGAVVCDPGAPGHGDCRSLAFRIVFLYFNRVFKPLMFIYSSETDRWVKVDFQDIALPRVLINVMRPCVQVGHVMYWQGAFTQIFSFNVSTHELREIPTPDEIQGEDYAARSNSNVVAPKDGSIGFVYITSHNLHLWVSNFINGVHVEWIPVRTVRLDNLLPLPDAREPQVVRIIGFDEDENVVYLWTKVGVFGLQLVQCSKKNC